MVCGSGSSGAGIAVPPKKGRLSSDHLDGQDGGGEGSHLGVVSGKRRQVEVSSVSSKNATLRLARLNAQVARRNLLGASGSRDGRMPEDENDEVQQQFAPDTDLATVCGIVLPIETHQAIAGSPHGGM